MQDLTEKKEKWKPGSGAQREKVKKNVYRRRFQREPLPFDPDAGILRNRSKLFF